ncbi:MAG: hypothetical protein H7067_10735 [Burkholderiales bacterium]|nr:hypothetical protein [Opitutaceae bacterium]
MRNSRSGTLSYRVKGTLRLGGKQQKEVFGTLEAAESCRDAWESVRVSNQAALRARATRLTQAELTTAETAIQPNLAAWLRAYHTGSTRPESAALDIACSRRTPAMVSAALWATAPGYPLTAGMKRLPSIPAGVITGRRDHPLGLMAIAQEFHNGVIAVHLRPADAAHETLNAAALTGAVHLVAIVPAFSAQKLAKMFASAPPS